MQKAEKAGRRILKQAVLLIAIVLAGLWLASASAVLVMNIAGYVGGPVHEWLADKGWPRVMRRCALFWAAVFLAIFLRRMGWRGWKDAGFTTDDPVWSRVSWRRLVSRGIVFGLAMMGVLCALNMFLGVRVPSPHKGWLAIANRSINFIMSGIFAALIEETICRGILFRLAARTWNVCSGAIIVSVFFALAHFVESAPEAFHGDGFLKTSTNVFISTLVMLPSEPDFWPRMLNLTLLGVVLSAMVIRTKTIWFGVGAHAAWVWMIKFNNYLTDLNQSSPLLTWFGRRGDFMDSMAAGGILAVMAGLILLRAAPACISLRKNGIHWHVAPEELDAFENWVDRHFRPDSRFVSNPGEDKRPDRAPRVLKEYEGCRVSAREGWIVKEYYPKPRWKSVRFLFMPVRARRGFMLARKLSSLGIPTPDAVAWAVKRRFLLARASFAVTREIENAQQMTNWLKEGLSKPEAREALASYGGLMAMFHINRFSNRDFKHENVMCSRSSPAILWVVDLDGVRKKWRITRGRAGKDLMRVGRSLKEFGPLSESNMRAFFDAYNGVVPQRLRRNDFPP